VIECDVKPHISAAYLCDLQVGSYDPFSDDPQLGVQKIVLCSASEMLFIGGTGGQVVVLHFELEEKEADVKVLTLFLFVVLIK